MASEPNSNVSFTSRDPLHSAVVDDATGQVLFEVETPRFKLGPRTTTIRNPAGQVVAEYEARLGHDRVTLHGHTRRLSDWLPEKSGLVPIDSKDPVVETHYPTLGVFEPKRRGGMSIRPELTPFLDQILLSFIICERERRKQSSDAGGG
ncbi:hypothetical protein L226DRAFT_612330 [Lentinus tigrinus ALCF2SS1-7]|uniref:DUF6593 domain-containing protein n=1 Tax=Lentinus tigrinus ALCF2SS1-6 TaxID=1328759 RepID=A0A5C2SDA6_9APHY|nr:hypothetical protein L227DRAFT_652399 [Lentinus tigrinus ALCF2SS1-6]RPD76089.1 hypothetical protein L226DRAFT_612330 [Lentinus tigrinus ALCF2SS1-7]